MSGIITGLITDSVTDLRTGLCNAVGGGGAEDLEYIYMFKDDGNQTYASGVAIIFNAERTEAAGLINTSGRVGTLEAGKTYWLIACLNNGGVTGTYEVQWFDVTGAASIGQIGRGISMNLNSAEYDHVYASAIFTPGVDSEVELRQLAGGTASMIVAGVQSFAIVRTF